MNSASSSFSSKFLWTIGTFGLSAGLKFGLNVVLSYLLAPQILGVMVIVNAVRLGIELLTDVGVEQNIVHHDDGLTRAFRDAAWTVQVTRGAFLSAIFFAAAPFFAHAYELDPRIFLLVASAPLLASLHSTAVFVLVKQLEVRRRNLFEIGSEAAAFVVQVGLALWLRSVWAPVFGLVATAAIRSALSYLLPDSAQRLRYDWPTIGRIVGFGKWIMVTTLLLYAASNVDRLYLGHVLPLALVGIYGIARTIADMPPLLARRVAYQIVFPAMAGDERRTQHRGAITSARRWFVLPACAAMAAAAGIADLLIAIVYDARYVEAGWMLSILLAGGVFTLLWFLNEGLLLAAGRPGYAALVGSARFATGLVLLLIGYSAAGIAGAVAAVALAEVLQYGYVALAQWRVGLHFWRQDAAAVALAAATLAVVIVLRSGLGWGSPLDGWAG